MSQIFNKPHTQYVNLIVSSVIRKGSALKIFVFTGNPGVNMCNDSLPSQL